MSAINAGSGSSSDREPIDYRLTVEALLPRAAPPYGRDGHPHGRSDSRTNQGRPGSGRPLHKGGRGRVASDFVVRDYRAWLLAVAKKSSNTVNART